MNEQENARLNELATKVLNEDFSNTELEEYKVLLDMWNALVAARVKH